MDKICFTCVKDSLVIGTITENFSHITWEKLLDILKSSNTHIIENKLIIQKGSIYDGKNFLFQQNEVEIIKLNLRNKTHIYYYSNIADIVKDYTLYIIKLFTEYLQKTDLDINISINTNEIIITNNKLIRIGINFEQIISSDDKFNYKLITNEEDYFNGSNIMIDYSIPNISFIKNNLNLINTNIYHIFPSIYETVIETDIKKNINTLTTFHGFIEGENRRLDFLNNLNISNHLNLNTCFDFEELKNNLIKTKILINVHGSDKLHTFEEIRILPALMCKVIVISEISPFIDLVPYKDLIIWSSFDDLVSKVHEVLNNYEFYYNTIFSENNLNLLNSLHLNNVNTINKLFENINNIVS